MPVDLRQEFRGFMSFFAVYGTTTRLQVEEHIM